MRLQSQEGWIEIEFSCYAQDSIDYLTGLFDVQNAVEIGFDYELADIGWGSVGYEYFIARDIKAIAKGFAEILLSEISHFSFSGSFPYDSLTPNPFYCIEINKREAEIEFYFKIHDRLIDYISITETMNIERFSEIAKEMSDASIKFPER